MQAQRKKEQRTQASWEREEARKERESKPDLYPSAYHSMTRRYLEDRGLDPDPQAALEREAQRNYDKRRHEDQLKKQQQEQEQERQRQLQQQHEAEVDLWFGSDEENEQPNEPSEAPPES